MSASDSANDEQLLTLVKQGDSSAFASLHDRYHKRLYSIALRITGNAQDAQDAVQDTFFQLWRKYSQFDSSRGCLIGWLLTITKHRAIERLRERHHVTSGDEPFDENDFAPAPQQTPLECEIARQLVSVAASQLSEAQRSAITLAYFEGLTLEEIASRTQTPLGTLKQRMRSGLRSMKKSLGVEPRSGLANQQRFPVLLEDIIITDELKCRPCRRRDPRQEADAIRALGASVDSVHDLINSFIDLPLELCHAGSGGLSLLETCSNGEQQFRWTNLSGKLASHIGGTTPRNFSPCGVTMDRGSPQLFKYQARYFHYFGRVDVPIVEGLVIPFNVGGQTRGTIWVASHDERLQFDSEDVRIMVTLAEFVGSAVHLNESLPLLFGGKLS